MDPICGSDWTCGREVKRTWLALSGEELAAAGERLDLHEVVLLEI